MLIGLKEMAEIHIALIVMEYLQNLLSVLYAEKEWRMRMDLIENIKLMRIHEVNQAFIDSENRKRQEETKKADDPDDDFEKIFEEVLKDD